MQNNNYRCCLCGEKSVGFGNNPAPIRIDGRCCDMCNSMYVIPTRIMLMDPRAKAFKDRQKMARKYYLFLKKIVPKPQR